MKILKQKNILKTAGLAGLNVLSIEQQIAIKGGEDSIIIEDMTET